MRDGLPMFTVLRTCGADKLNPISASAPNYPLRESSSRSTPTGSASASGHFCVGRAGANPALKQVKAAGQHRQPHRAGRPGSLPCAGSEFHGPVDLEKAYSPKAWEELASGATNLRPLAERLSRFAGSPRGVKSAPCGRGAASFMGESPARQLACPSIRSQLNRSDAGPTRFLGLLPKWSNHGCLASNLPGRSPGLSCKVPEQYLSGTNAGCRSKHQKSAESHSAMRVKSRHLAHTLPGIAIKGSLPIAIVSVLRGDPGQIFSASVAVLSRELPRIARIRRVGIDGKVHPLATPLPGTSDPRGRFMHNRGSLRCDSRAAIL